MKIEHEELTRITKVSFQGKSHIRTETSTLIFWESENSCIFTFSYTTGNWYRSFLEYCECPEIEIEYQKTLSPFMSEQ